MQCPFLRGWKEDRIKTSFSPSHPVPFLFVPISIGISSLFLWRHQLAPHVNERGDSSKVEKRGFNVLAWRPNAGVWENLEELSGIIRLKVIYCMACMIDFF